MARTFDATKWSPDCISIRTIAGAMESDIVELGKLTERLPVAYDVYDNPTLRGLLMRDATFIQNVCRACSLEPDNIAQIISANIKQGTGLGVIRILLTADTPAPESVLRHHAQKGLDSRVQTFRQCFGHLFAEGEVPEGYWLHEYNRTLASIEGRATRLAAERDYESAVRDAFTVVESVRKYGGKAPAWTRTYIRQGKPLPMPESYVKEYAARASAGSIKHTMLEYLPPAQRITATKLSEETLAAIHASEQALAKQIAASMTKRVRANQGQAPKSESDVL